MNTKNTPFQREQKREKGKNRVKDKNSRKREREEVVKKSGKK